MYESSISNLSKSTLLTRSPPILSTLALLLAGAAAFADDSAQELLRNMHDATRELNYDGVFVYQRGDQIDSMRLIHKFADGTETERLISLSGPAREVIRDGTQVTCLFADDHAATDDPEPAPRHRRHRLFRPGRKNCSRVMPSI
jgi:negative regulator of sigma E activity